MALAPQPMQQQGQQAPQEQSQGQGDADKQAMFEQLAGPKLEYIYGNGLEDVKNVLQSGSDNPAVAIGDLVGKLMASSAMNAMDNGATVPPDVMTATGLELTNNVTDIALNMGMVDKAQAGEIGEEAFITAIGVFGKIAVGNAIGPAEKQQYSSIVSEMKELMNMKGGQESPQPQQEAQPEQPQSMSQAMM